MILLEGDKRQVKDERGRIHNVYRVYYDEDVVLGDYHIHSGSVGGYAETLENIDNVILQNNAVVLADVKLQSCLVRDDAFIAGGSYKECIFEGRATLYGQNEAFNSVFSDSATIKGNFKIENSTFERSSYASGHGKIKETTLTGGGHILNGDVEIENCRIEDVAEVTGHTKMKNSYLSGRVVIKDGNINNQTLSYDYTLNVVQGQGEL